MKVFEKLTEFATQLSYVGDRVSFSIGNFETAAKVHEFQVWEIDSHAEENLCHFQKDIYILDFRSGMNVKSIDFYFILLNELLDFGQLSNGDAKLGVAMAS